MKRIFILLFALTLVFSLAACGQKNDPDKESEDPSIVDSNDIGTNDEQNEQDDNGKGSEEVETPSEVGNEDTASNDLADIMAQILDGLENLPFTENRAVESDMFEAFLFIPYAAGYEAIANEAMISAIAHSAVLLHVPNGTDIENVAKSIEENANSNKWICVFAEKTTVTINGEYILLVMSSEENTDAITENFSNLSL